MTVIFVVDYGVVCLESIRNMLRKLVLKTTLVSTPAGTNRSTKILLPGVGVFDHGILAWALMRLLVPF